MTPERKAKLIVWLNALTLIGGAITVILLLRIISTAANQNTSTNTKIVQSQKATENELRCLAAFFSQSNRQNLKISNLEKCQIIHTDTGQTETLPLTPVINTSSTTPAVPSSDTKQNSTPNTTPTQANKPQNNTSQMAPSQTVPQVSNNPQPASPLDQTKPPQKLLGVQLCVPFTHICVR